MSYANLPQQQYGTSGMMPEEEHSCPSSVPWIVGLVILFLIAIGLGIWLLILYLGGHVGCDQDRLITVTNPSITANANDVTATWGTLGNETDKVTLYVSEKPLIINSSGKVLNTPDILKQDSKTGSNNTLDITVPANRSYNAMILITNTDTVNYLVYGPRKVFTQTNNMLLSSPANADPGVLFNIGDLDSCNGSVSSGGGYTMSSSQTGIFRLGTPGTSTNTNTNPKASSFIVNWGNDPTSPEETNMLLCRIRETTTDVGMGVWINNDDSNGGEPVICTRTPTTTTSGTCDTGTTIPSVNCQWSYNDLPSVIRGQNKWCLAAPQSTTANNATNVPLCLVHNGSTSLGLATGSTSTDTWYNAPVNTNFLTINT